jgi:hypothetical protein
MDSAESFALQIDGVDNADDCGVDGGVGSAGGGHGGEAIRGEQNTFANAGACGVKGQDWITAIRAVQVKRLHDEDFASFVGGHFLRGHDVSDNAPDQHAEKCRVES